MFLWLKFKPEDLDEELSRISGQGRPETGIATGDVSHHATPQRSPRSTPATPALDLEVKGLRALLAEVQLSRDQWQAQAEAGEPSPDLIADLGCDGHSVQLRNRRQRPVPPLGRRGGGGWRALGEARFEPAPPLSLRGVEGQISRPVTFSHRRRDPRQFVREDGAVPAP